MFGSQQQYVIAYQEILVQVNQNLPQVECHVRLAMNKCVSMSFAAAKFDFRYTQLVTCPQTTLIDSGCLGNQISICLLAGRYM